MERRIPRCLSGKKPLSAKTAAWSNSDDFSNISYQIHSGIYYELATDKFLYTPQDTLHIQYTITNKNHPFIIFRSPSSHKIDFALFMQDVDTLLWYKSNSKFRFPSVEFKKIEINESWNIQIALSLSTINTFEIMEDSQRLMVGEVIGEFEPSKKIGEGFHLLSSIAYSFSFFNDPFF